MNKKLILLFSFILFHSVVMKSQSKIEKYSVAGKLTMAIFSDYYYEGIELNALGKSYIYSIGYYYGEDNEFLGDDPSEEYNQINLLFGKYIDTKNEKLRFQYQGGIGMYWGTIRTDKLDESDTSWLTNRYFTKEISTIGFPLKIGGRYIPFKFLSIGIDLQANLNFQKSIIRPMFSIEIGKLRN